MKRMIFRIGVLIAIATLGGCGTASSVSTGISIANHTDFQFSDDRPYEERASRQYKSPAEIVSLYGDDALSPPAPDSFKSYLAADLNQTLSGKTVKLIRFSVTVYVPDASIDSNNPAAQTNPVGFVLAAPFILGIESAKSKKLVTVDIRSSIEGKDYSSLCSDHFRGSVSEEDIRSVVLTCLKRIHDDIKIAYAQ